MKAIKSKNKSTSNFSEVLRLYRRIRNAYMKGAEVDRATAESLIIPSILRQLEKELKEVK